MQNTSNSLALAVQPARLEESLRAQLLELHVRLRLADVIAGTADLQQALISLNPLLGDEWGVAVKRVAILDSAQRNAIGGAPPNSTELEAVGAWRRAIAHGHGELLPGSVDDGLLAPVANGQWIAGVLQVVIVGPLVAPGVLVPLGAWCAEAVGRAALQRRLAANERRLAVTAERDRIAYDLHDSVGQLLVAIKLVLSDYLTEASNPLWRAQLKKVRDLAAEGSSSLRDAISSLLFRAASQQGLTESVRELVGTVRATHGVDAAMKVIGVPYALEPATEDTLFRVVLEALTNVARHARASSVSVRLRYQPGQVRMTIQDDGVGLGQRDPLVSTAHHFGLRAIQQRMEKAGGSLRVQDGRPNGVVVSATLPVMR
jgi:signal transduction histidine kinase